MTSCDNWNVNAHCCEGKCKIHHIKRTGRTIKPAHQKVNKFIIYVIVGEMLKEYKLLLKVWLLHSSYILYSYK